MKEMGFGIKPKPLLLLKNAVFNFFSFPAVFIRMLILSKSPYRNYSYYYQCYSYRQKWSKFSCNYSKYTENNSGNDKQDTRPFHTATSIVLVDISSVPFYHSLPSLIYVYQSIDRKSTTLQFVVAGIRRQQANRGNLNKFALSHPRSITER